MEIIWALGLFVAIALALLIGYPVAITLGGVSLWFALAGWFAGWFDTSFLMAMPNRVYGIMTNVTLMAVPVFVFMGLVLEKAKLAESLLENMAALMGKVRVDLVLHCCLWECCWLPAPESLVQRLSHWVYWPCQ